MAASSNAGLALEQEVAEQIDDRERPPPHNGSCQGNRASHSSGSVGPGSCPCCSVPPTCVTCSTLFVAVIIIGAVAGAALLRCNMSRDATVADLMRRISSSLGIRQVHQKLVVRSVHGSGVLHNKFVQMRELIPPGRSKVRLQLAKVAQPPCACCHKEDGEVSDEGSVVKVRLCGGCFSIVCCSDDCRALDWPANKTECRRQYEL